MKRLSKSYKAKDVAEVLQVLTQQLSTLPVQPESFLAYINIAVQTTAKSMNEALLPVYGEETVINSVLNTFKTFSSSTSYNPLTRVLTDNDNIVTSVNIGDYLAVFDITNGLACISEIVGVSGDSPTLIQIDEQLANYSSVNIKYALINNPKTISPTTVAKSRVVGSINGGVITVGAGHGLTVYDVGKPLLLLHETDGQIVLAEVTSILSETEFATNANPFLSAASVSFIVDEDLRSEYVDLSDLRISSVIRLTDTNYGDVTEVKDRKFELLHKIPQHKKSKHYNYFGDKLRLFKGYDAPSWGKLKLRYLREPMLCATLDDYLDIPDSYVDLVIAKSKKFVYEQLRKQMPEDIKQYIDTEMQKIKQSVYNTKQENENR